MVQYRFRCACGVGIVVRSRMGEAPAYVVCMGCGRRALREYSTPALTRAISERREDDRAGLAAMDATRRADEAGYDARWSQPRD